ncbi:MAG: DUF2723 domain-containing protein [bacterium]
MIQMKYPDRGQLGAAWLMTMIFLVSVGCYLAALCPGVYWLDSGEFQTAVPTLGIPHSPSFPSYLMSTHAICRLPLGDIAFRVNVATAVAGGLIGALAFLLAWKLFGSGGNRNKWPACFVGLAATMNPLIWFQNVKAEVYSLNMIWILIILLCAVDMLQHTDNRRRMFRNLNTIALMFGLGGANHSLLTLHLVPAVVVMLLFVIQKFKIRELLFAGQVGLLALSSYLYLPIRAVKNPALNIGNPINVMNFINAITRRGTHNRFMGNKAAEWFNNWPIYFGLIRDHFSSVFLFLAVIGLVILVVKIFKSGLVLLLAALTNMSVTLMNRNFNMNPDTGPAYLMMSTIILIIGLGAVFRTVLNICDSVRLHSMITALVIAGMLFIPGVWAWENLKSEELSQDISAAVVGKGILDICPEDSILFYGAYFNLPFVVSYLQAVENYRSDIVGINRMEIVYWPGGLEKALRTYPDVMATLFEGDYADTFQYLAGRSARHSKAIPYERARNLLFNANAWVATKKAEERYVFWFSSEDDHLLRLPVHSHGPLLRLGDLMPERHPILKRPSDIVAARAQANDRKIFHSTRGAEALGAFYDLQCATLRDRGLAEEAEHAKSWSIFYDPEVSGACQ